MYSQRARSIRLSLGHDRFAVEIGCTIIDLYVQKYAYSSWNCMLIVRYAVQDLTACRRGADSQFKF